jgi:hypothetical protein
LRIRSIPFARSIPVILVGVLLTLFLVVFAAEASGPRPIIGGDLDCSGVVAPRDGQRLLNYVLGQPQIAPITTPCPNVGQMVNLHQQCTTPPMGYDCGFTTQIFGDVDCNGLVTTADGQKILQFVLGTPYHCDVDSLYRQEIGILPRRFGGGNRDLWTQW